MLLYNNFLNQTDGDTAKANRLWGSSEYGKPGGLWDNFVNNAGRDGIDIDSVEIVYKDGFLNLFKQKGVSLGTGTLRRGDGSIQPASTISGSAGDFNQ
jgi:hypothetical protein